MGRQKKNPDYNPERARDELVKAVCAFYLNPPSEDMKGRDGKTRMKNMELEFGLSMGKIRKLLVTGGVYSFEKDGVDLVEEIARLREEGLSDGEIKEKLSISRSLLNALTPYKKGVYNADFTADGYEYSNVSTEARKKRNQRKREKMKETNAVEDHEKEIEGAKRQMDEQKYPGMTEKEIEEEKARRRAENEARHQANLEKKRKYHERKAWQEENDPGDYLRLAERFKDSMPEYAEECRRRHEIEMRKKNGERFSPEQIEAYVHQGSKKNASYTREETIDELRKLMEESERKSAHLQEEYEKMKAREQSEKSRIEKIDEYTYAQAIDHDAYDNMPEEDKKANEDLRRRILELMSREEEIVLPEIDEETLGERWKSKETVKGRPVGDFLFFPDTSRAFRLPNGRLIKVEERAALGVFDANHEKHIFLFDTIGPTVAYIFRAIEVKKVLKNGKLMAGQPDTNYEFSVMGKLEDQEACIGRLIDKIVISLQNLTIHRSGRSLMGIDSPRQYLTDKYVLSVNETGHAMIEYDGHDGVTFQIDGHTFSPEDVMKLFSPYEGCELQFAIRDCGDSDAFTNDIVLYPVEMNEDAFIDELAKILVVVSDRHEGKFIRKDMVRYLDILMVDMLKKLTFYLYNENRSEARRIAEVLISILEGIGTDSTVFPEYEIQLIRNATTFPWEKEEKEELEDFEKALSMAKDLNRILIVEGKVDFDTSDAIVIDCEKSKERKVKGYTVFKNAEKCSRDELTLIRQSWDENHHPVVIWSNKKLGKKVDDHLKWRALYFKGE